MKTIGIDLGTTYSCVAYIKQGQAEIINNAEGDPTTPSVVWFDNNRIIVGKEAKEMLNVEPDNVCSFVKRQMGKEWTFTVNGSSYTPQEISAFILKKLVKDASARLGEEIIDVVITCPAYFSFREREATKQAGEIAGLNVLQILNEPTAAAYSYGLDANVISEKHVLVYDLGGGTFDTTLIKVSRTGVDVVCTDGNHQLGGKDWDDALVSHLADRFNQVTGENANPAEDSEFYYELLEKAETMKKQLSERTSVKTNISHNGSKTSIEVTRTDFERITQALLNQTVELTHSLMKVAKKQGITKIDKLLLVGGSSRMPQVAAVMEKEFGVKSQLYEPDEAVAKGAAMVGSEKYKIPTKNVASKTFGITVLDGYNADHTPILSVCNLIYRNTTLPFEKTEKFATIADDQQIVVVELLENNIDAPNVNSVESKETPDGMNVLWNGELPLKPDMPKHSKIDVTFRIEKDGRLFAKAYDPETGNYIDKIIPEFKKSDIKIMSAQLQKVE
jgi:molecular chaperone DnaK (HSP70)